MRHFWLTHNLPWIIASIVFSTSIFIVALKTDYKQKWAYNAVSFNCKIQRASSFDHCLADAFCPANCHDHNGLFSLANSCRQICPSRVYTWIVPALSRYDVAFHCWRNLWLFLYDGKNVLDYSQNKFHKFPKQVLKLSLSTNNCYIVVKRTDDEHSSSRVKKVILDFSDEESLWLCSIQRICLALFLAISCFYIMQKLRKIFK
jgi:hypothetical protein